MNDKNCAWCGGELKGWSETRVGDDVTFVGSCARPVSSRPHGAFICLWMAPLRIARASPLRVADPGPSAGNGGQCATATLAAMAMAATWFV